MAFLPKYPQFRSAIQHLSLKDNIVKASIGLAMILLVAFLFPRGEAIEYEYTVGGIWVNNDLIAPFSFPIYKDEEQYEEETRAAAANVAPVFQRNDLATAAQKESLAVMIDRARLSPPLRHLWSKRVSLLEMVDDVLNTGVVDQPVMRREHKQVAVRHGVEESLVGSEEVYDLERALAILETRLFSLFAEPSVAANGLEMFRTILRPNLMYSRSETEKLIQVAIESVPRTTGFVQANERIIGKHELITKEIKLKLDSLRKIRAERGTEHSHIWQYLGVSAHVGVVSMLYGVYLFLFRKRIFHDNRMLALVSLLIIMPCLLTYLSLQLAVETPIQYLILVPTFSMLLAIIFDSRVAFYGTVIIAFLIAGIRGNDYSIALASMVAGALSVYTVRDIRHRTQIFRSLVFILLGYALVIIALGLERFASLATIATELSFAFVNAVVSPVFAYGMLIFFERVFKVTTDLTLLELSDFNHPLLRQLSEKAPGTFHHSVTLGNLAEAAADAIGANAILARVGAYYHDIGKVVKPEYFVENQSQGKSRHGRLRPRMSALIIASHVKEGVEMGRQSSLPDVVLDFIPQHHGTTLMSFFYDKALKLAEVKHDPRYEVNESDYRYPGPKPQSKETGIVMLADAAEATARSMDDPTPHKLEAMIDSTIRNRFAEGQLDECELTLRDLTKIKEAFLKILIGIHHTRVKYPEQTQEPGTPPAIQEKTENAVEHHTTENADASGPPAGVADKSTESQPAA